MDQLISKEVAKLARECKFHDPTLFAWRRNEDQPFEIGDNMVTYWTQYKDYQYYCPTQTHLSRWLREKHKIHVESISVDSWNCWTWKITAEDAMAPFVNIIPEELIFEANTYEEALEEGLKQALLILKDRLNVDSNTTGNRNN